MGNGLLPGAQPQASHHAIRVQLHGLVRADNSHSVPRLQLLPGQMVDGADHIGGCPLNQGQISLRSIVLILHPGRLGLHIGVHRAVTGNRRIEADLHAQHLTGHLLCDGSRAQNHRILPRHIDNRGFHTDSHRSAIHDHVDLSVHVLPYVIRRRRAGPTRRIGAGGRYRYTGKPDERHGHRIAGHADRHGIQSSCRAIWNGVTLRKYHGQRSRPECLHQLPRRLRNLRHQRLQIRKIRDMCNQRIVRRSSFCCVYLLCRFLIEGIGPEPIHGLRRKCHQTALSQNLRRSLQLSRIYPVRIFYYNSFRNHLSPLSFLQYCAAQCSTGFSQAGAFPLHTYCLS